MTLNDEQKKIVVNAGEIGLSTDTLAYQLQVDESELKRELMNSGSEIAKYFRIGKELQMVDVYEAMKNKALKGDSAAAEMVMKIKREYQYQKKSRELFGD